MNPEDYSDLITAYVANTLTPEQRHAFEQELEGNEGLRKKLAIHEMAQEFVPKENKVEDTVISVDPVKMPEPEGMGSWWMIGLALLGVLLIVWLMYRQ